MFHRRLKVSLAAVVLALSVLSAQRAIAVDGKVYPGAMCQPVLGIGSHAGGTLANDSTSGSLVVECPVVREIVSGTIQGGQVRVYQTATTFCTLHVKSYFGNNGPQQLVVSAPGEGFRTLSFDAMSASNNRPFYYLNVARKCD